MWPLQRHFNHQNPKRSIQYLCIHLVCLMILGAWGSNSYQMVSELELLFGWLLNQNLHLYWFNLKSHIHLKSISKNPPFDFPNPFQLCFICHRRYCHTWTSRSSKEAYKTNSPSEEDNDFLTLVVFVWILPSIWYQFKQLRIIFTPRDTPIKSASS